MWHIPYYQRQLSLQALASGLSPISFVKLLSIWPQNVLLPQKQLQRLLSLLGIAHNEATTYIYKMKHWNILLEFTEPFAQSQSSNKEETDKDSYYLLNPRHYDYISHKEETQTERQYNRLDSNWELYCDLRHPENYIDLLLCARLQHFAELSLFYIEKPIFQKYFNAESSKFEQFLQHIPKFERHGIYISEFICQQWQEWFHESARFQLFKNCVLVCPSSYNELIIRLLSDTESTEPSSEHNDIPDSVILCNPYPGVFYLDEQQHPYWYDKLNNAGIHLSEPFKTPVSEFNSSAYKTLLNSNSFQLPEKLLYKQKTADSPIATKQLNDGDTVNKTEMPEFPWNNWPSNPQSFVESRQLILSNINLKQLPIHFREARGIDYTAKQNLLHSLLSARNYMAIITVVEDEQFNLASYIVLPISVDGPKEHPSLIALDLRQGCLKKFDIRNITRVNEVFYSLINISLLGLLPSDYVFLIEKEFREAQT